MSTVLDLPASAKLMYKPNARITGDSGGYGAQLGWVCDYADQDAFLEVVIGQRENVGNNVSRIVPLRHPTYTNMLATSFTADGFGHDATAPPNPFGYQYSKSKILVTFKIPPFPIVGDEPFMVIRRKHSTQAITIPESGYKFPSTGKKIEGVDSAQTVSTTAYMVTLYQCPDRGDDLIDSLGNKLNSTPIFNKAAGLVRFDGADVEVVQLKNGQMTYTKSLTFLYRSHNWNELINESGEWEAPEKVSDSSTIYESDDLNQLFQ